MGMIPKTVKAEQKLSLGMFNFTLNRIIGIFITAMMSLIFARFMPKLLGIGFVVFCLVIYFILTSKSPSNPLKLYYKGLLDYLSYKLLPKKIYSTKSEEWIRSEEKRKEIADAKKKRKTNKQE